MRFTRQVVGGVPTHTAPSWYMNQISAGLPKLPSLRCVAMYTYLADASCSRTDAGSSVASAAPAPSATTSAATARDDVVRVMKVLLPRMQPQRQRGDAAEDDARVKRQRRVVDPLEGAGTIEERRERDLRLEAREIGAEAVVRPEAEGEVAVVGAGDVEALAVREHVLVAVRRPEPADDELIGVDAVAVQLERAGRSPRIHLHRRRPPHHLVDGGRQERALGAQPRQRVGMVEERQHGVADQVRRRL